MKWSHSLERLAEQQRRYARLHPLALADADKDPGFFGRPSREVTWGLTLNK